MASSEDHDSGATRVAMGVDMTAGLLPHGGRLREAARAYDIPLAQWLDLSTGINPKGWPVPELPSKIWLRLPEEGDGLEAAACAYYGAADVLPVAGSQAAIQALPGLRAQGRVGVLDPGYAEHAQAWQRAGHEVLRLGATQIEATLDRLDALVLIHPNNPTGERFAPATLLGWYERLAARGGWLVVDEAFIDATPEASLLPLCPRPGLVVLRSLGKFFGLAGARVGFVFAEPALLRRLRLSLGPWTLPAPSRWVAAQALSDRTWQVQTRLRLEHDGARLAGMLARHGLAASGGCALFQWVRHERARAWHAHLARLGILTRLFDAPASLRLGLPAAEADWLRLEAALAIPFPTFPMNGGGDSAPGEAT